MTNVNIKPYTLATSKFNADLDAPVNVRVSGLSEGQIAFGTKVMYTAARGSYDIGYYLGLSKDGRTAVCIFGGRYGYYPNSVSRVDPMHLFVTDWEDHHVRSRFNGTPSTDNIHTALEEIRKQRGAAI